MKRVFLCLFLSTLSLLNIFFFGCSQKHVHDYDLWSVVKEGTCIEEGTQSRVCKTCGYVESAPTSKTNHVYDNTTCTEPSKCTLCGATTGVAAGHNYTSATSTELSLCSVCGEENKTVPNGGCYISLDGSVYNPGDEFPVEVKLGDVFVYGEYEYCYKAEYSDGYWKKDLTQIGWGVRVLDKRKTTYESVLTSINNQPVTSLSYTYYNCDNMVKTPNIPSTITNLDSTFRNCNSLVDASNLVIPEGVTCMFATFCDSYALSSAPTIPSTVTDMRMTFSSCFELGGSITINASPDRHADAIRATNITEILGDCTIKDKILNSKYYYDVNAW